MNLNLEFNKIYLSNALFTKHQWQNLITHLPSGGLVYMTSYDGRHEEITLGKEQFKKRSCFEKDPRLSDLASKIEINENTWGWYPIIYKKK
jgi:hypothetical protein